VCEVRVRCEVREGRVVRRLRVDGESVHWIGVLGWVGGLYIMGGPGLVFQGVTGHYPIPSLRSYACGDCTFSVYCKDVRSKRSTVEAASVSMSSKQSDCMGYPHFN
jgi:hypothetical protein